jgi:hypothetical protein
VRYAVAASIRTVGNVQFVAADERAGRIGELKTAGVAAVISSSSALETLFGSRRSVST